MPQDKEKPKAKTPKNNKAHGYLLRYGYYEEAGLLRRMSKTSEIASKTLADVPDRGVALRRAILRFQTIQGIGLSGELDEATLEAMSRPRCGLSDEAAIRTFTFGKPQCAVHPNQWTQGQELTYGIVSFTSHLDQATIRQQIQQAIRKWDAVCSLQFRETKDRADIRFSFLPESHTDGFPFETDEHAHAFPPLNGDVHFNDERVWVVGKVRGAIDLETVALHEIGHALGLDHSSEIGSVMNGTYNGVDTSLSSGDVACIRQLYGP